MTTPTYSFLSVEYQAEEIRVDFSVEAGLEIGQLALEVVNFQRN